jgi:predicted  nucleic acid-binding Zn-ribbon protein
LHRVHNINNEINADKGHLNGHAGQLQSEDASVREQEQSDAKAHDGHITKDEQNQLNQEENQIKKQIGDDK